jgi:hypothetical protein
MVYAGHQECYAKGNEILQHFPSIEISASQIYKGNECRTENTFGGKGIAV